MRNRTEACHERKKYHPRDVPYTVENPTTRRGVVYQVITQIPQGTTKVAILSHGRNSMMGLPADTFYDKVDRFIQRVTIRRLLRKGFGVISFSYPNFMTDSPEAVKDHFDSVSDDIVFRASQLPNNPEKLVLATSAGSPSAIKASGEMENVLAVVLNVPAVKREKRKKQRGNSIPDQTEAISGLRRVPKVLIRSTILDGYFPPRVTWPFVRKIKEAAPDAKHRIGILPHPFEGALNNVAKLGSSVRLFNQARRNVAY